MGLEFSCLVMSESLPIYISCKIHSELLTSRKQIRVQFEDYFQIVLFSEMLHRSVSISIRKKSNRKVR